MNPIFRSLITPGLLAILAFCSFGFLATYELAAASERLPWQLGYGAASATCLFATARLWCWRRGAPPSKPGERNE